VAAADGVPVQVAGHDGPEPLDVVGDGLPFCALVRVGFGPVPLDFDRLAAEFPAIRSGFALAGGADLELRLVCGGPQELRAVSTALLRAGAVRVQVDLVLRALTPAPPTLRPVP
ncbi:hypothetical protein, partial [Kitasatospora sp. NPDC005748]|uniref:hypothetical protein n=1 Tax=Kitasatospora sp. NPDC005748 TaxID=3157063 RepID=UPI0033F6BD23